MAQSRAVPSSLPVRTHVAVGVEPRPPSPDPRVSGRAGGQAGRGVPESCCAVVASGQGVTAVGD